MKRLLLLGLTFGAYGCRACFTPGLPNPDPPDDNTQDSPTHDSAVDSSTEDDTGPTPPCDVPEVEPNNTQTTAQDLGTELWACGTLLEEGDIDWFRFRAEEEGWYRIQVRGEDIGTSADMQISLFNNNETDYTTVATSSPNSLDPILVFPITNPDTFYTNVSDQYYGYGKDYIWEMIISEVKAPVDWDMEEVEPNNFLGQEQLVTSGLRIFGTINPGSDTDRFVVNVNDERATLNAQIYAWNYNSPLTSQLQVQDAKGVQEGNTAYYGVNTYDLDPIISRSIPYIGQWTVVVARRSDTPGGGAAYWYVLEVNIDVDDTVEKKKD